MEMATREEWVKREKVLGDFGEFALQSESLDEVLHQACVLIGEALGTDLAKIMEIEEGGETLLVSAGVGWEDGLVGETRLSMSDPSSETYAIALRGPVVVTDIAREDRFAFPAFLTRHGVRAMVNAPIFLPGGRHFGLLQVDAKEPRDFGEEDIQFLRTYTALLGPVIDRLHKSHSLKEALDTNRRLLRELQHRVKNHMTVIAGLVRIRAGETTSDEARQELEHVGARIETLQRVHEHLHEAGTTDALNLDRYIGPLVKNLAEIYRAHSGGVGVKVDIGDVTIGPDIAVPLGLIVNEFVTNSLKHAFDGKGGVISVSVTHPTPDTLAFLLADNGKGLRADPPGRKGRGSGITLIDALIRQVGGEPVWPSGAGGTALRFEVACDRP